MKLDLKYNEGLDRLEVRKEGSFEGVNHEGLQITFFRNGKVIKALPFVEVQSMTLEGYHSGRFHAVCSGKGEAVKSNSVFKGQKTVIVQGESITYYEEKGSYKGAIIIFTAMIEDYAYTYNYVDTLESVDRYKLFILDNRGRRGCYYLGENGKRTFEKAITQFIQDKMKSWQVTKENVITMGSSKGGYSALYYGIKLEVGYVIAAAPQFLLGNFLYDHYGRKNVVVAEEIMGTQDEKANKQALNKILEQLIETKSKEKRFPHIYMIIGKQDDHYKPQFLPLLECLVKNDIAYTVVRDESLTHKTLTGFFCPHLKYLLDSQKNNEPMLHTLVNTMKQIEQKDEVPVPGYSNKYGEDLLATIKDQELLISTLLYYRGEINALKDLVKALKKSNAETLEAINKTSSQQQELLQEKIKRVLGYLVKNDIKTSKNQ